MINENRLIFQDTASESLDANILPRGQQDYLDPRFAEYSLTDTNNILEDTPSLAEWQASDIGQAYARAFLAPPETEDRPHRIRATFNMIYAPGDYNERFEEYRETFIQPRSSHEARAILDYLLDHPEVHAPFVPKVSWDSAFCAANVTGALNFLVGNDRFTEGQAWTVDRIYGPEGTGDLTRVWTANPENFEEVSVEDIFSENTYLRPTEDYEGARPLDELGVNFLLDHTGVPIQDENGQYMIDGIYIAGYHYQGTGADSAIEEERGEGGTENSHLVLITGYRDGNWYGFHMLHNGLANPFQSVCLNQEYSGAPGCLGAVENQHGLGQMDLTNIWRVSDFQLPATSASIELVPNSVSYDELVAYSGDGNWGQGVAHMISGPNYAVEQPVGGEETRFNSLSQLPDANPIPAEYEIQLTFSAANLNNFTTVEDVSLLLDITTLDNCPNYIRLTILRYISHLTSEENFSQSLDIDWLTTQRVNLETHLRNLDIPSVNYDLDRILETQSDIDNYLQSSQDREIVQGESRDDFALNLVDGHEALERIVDQGVEHLQNAEENIERTLDDTLSEASRMAHDFHDSPRQFLSDSMDTAGGVFEQAQIDLGLRDNPWE